MTIERELRSVPVEDITINDRIRQTDGDSVTMIQSVVSYGVIEPIILNAKLELIAGYRRLKAAIANKQATINAVIVETPDPRGMEIAENVHREGFTNHELMIAAEDRLKHHASKDADKKRKTEAGIPQRVADDLGISKTKVWRLLHMSDVIRLNPDKFKDVVTMLQDREHSLSQCYDKLKTLERGYEAKAKQKDKKTSPTEYHAPERTEKEPTARTEPDEQDSEPETWEHSVVDHEESKQISDLTEDGRAAMLDAVGKQVPSHLRDVFAFNATMDKYINVIVSITGAMKSAYGYFVDSAEVETKCGELIEVLENHKAYTVCGCKKGCEHCCGNEARGEKRYLTKPKYLEITKEAEAVSF